MSYPIKRTLVILFHFLTWPLALPARVLYRVFGSYGLFRAVGALFSLVPGLPGQYLRASYYCQTLRHCPHDVAVGFLSMILHPEARLDHNVYIGSFCVIGNARIGARTAIASRVLIGRADYDGPAAKTAISIGAHCWLGESATVMADVGAGCIVGAGATVEAPIAAGTKVAGNPMRVIDEIGANS